MNAWLGDLNAAATPLLLDHVWPILWQSSLLIVLIALAGRTVFRRSPPQLRYALWGLVLIRLVVPPWVDLPTALGHWGMPEVREQVAAYIPLDAAPTATAMLQRPLVGEISPEVILPAIEGGADAPPAVAPSIAWSWATLLVTLWGLGVASLFLLLLIRLLRMRRALKHGAVAPDWILQAIADYRSALGVRWPVRARVVAGNHSPALMGLLRPTILLPEGALQQLQEDQLRAILAHEIAHVKRWDFLVNWAQVILGIAYFFHPLLWFANREMRRERELACDDLTLITLGLNREGYAKSLLRVAEGLSTVRRLAPVQVGVMEGELELARRLRRILDQKIRPVPRLTALSLAMVIAFAAVFGTWHQTVAENKPEAAVPAEEVETRIFEVKVVDEVGQPLEGADVSLVFVRAGVGLGSIAGLRPNFGKPDSVKTSSAGMAAVRYPRYVMERKETVAVMLIAGHAEYVSGVQVELNVDETSPTIVLDRGATLRVSAYLGERHNTVTPLFAKLSGSPVGDWRPAENGILERRDLRAKQHYLLLIHPEEDGTLYFTDYFRFYPTQGMTHEFSLPLQKGVQLTGKVSESVARPVKNGWVEVRVLPILEVNFDRYGEGNLEWTAHSAINEDGSFVIEGLPRGRGEITAACEGAVSMGESRPHMRPDFGAPILTTLDRETNEVEVTMAPTATAVVRVTGPDGKPVAGAKLSFWPIVWHFDQYKAIFGKAAFSSAEALQRAQEESAADRQDMAEKFAATSDESGAATIENLPPWVSKLTVESSDFELPPDAKGFSRRLIELRPGETTEVAVELVAKETDLPVADAPVASAAPTDREKAKASSAVAPSEPRTDQSEAAAPTEEVETRTLEVKVVDEAGKPVEGASIAISLLGSRTDPDSSYGWDSDIGRPGAVKTDNTGIAIVPFSRYLVKSKEIEFVAVIARHPDYAAGDPVELNADGSSPPVVLEAGVTLRVSGYLEQESEVVAPVFALLSGTPIGEWQTLNTGAIERRDLLAGPHCALLIHEGQDGALYFSDPVEFETEKGAVREFNLRLRRGTSIVGRLDSSAPRPIKNGWVEVRIVPKSQVGPGKYPEKGSVQWTAQAAVEEDGSFVIKYLPSGHAEITAACDGAVSLGEAREGTSSSIASPIVTILDQTSAEVEVPMVGTATAVVRTTGPDGNPVKGATVTFSPNVNYLVHPRFA